MKSLWRSYEIQIGHFRQRSETTDGYDRDASGPSHTYPFFSGVGNHICFYE
jgi:hypothetical protein